MAFHKAYLGKQLQDLLSICHQQMQKVYESKGLVIPVEGSSTLQVLEPKACLALADIARILEQPHQLVAQRIRKLVALGLVKSQQDPNDGRRTEYVLTNLGKVQWQLLDSLMQESIHVNESLYEDAGTDLSAALNAVTTCLQERSFLQRFLNATNSTNKETN